MSGVIASFPEKITTDSGPTEYYPIVAELAKLKRNDLKIFKERFKVSMKKPSAEEFAVPYRMASPRTNCGFAFVPLLKYQEKVRRQGLENLTRACKYDLKVQKCVGISFLPDGGGWYTIEWIFLDFPW